MQTIQISHKKELMPYFIQALEELPNNSGRIVHILERIDNYIQSGLIEIKGERWVVSGDYKVVDDGLSTPFKPIKCHSFISECTFGLPAFNWSPQEQVFKEINSWWHQCTSDGLTPILAAYGLGKAQRLIAGLDTNLSLIHI